MALFGVRLRINYNAFLTSNRCYNHLKKTIATNVDHEVDEYTETAEYPPILYKGVKPDKKYRDKLFADSIKDLPTVEEKLLDLSSYQRLYNVTPFHSHSEALKAMQYCTRTHLISSLPDVYNNFEVDTLINKVKPRLVEALITDYNRLKSENEMLNLSERERNHSISQGIINQISNIVFNVLPHDFPHLWNVQVDQQARTEAFWRCEFLGTRFLGIPFHEGHLEIKRSKVEPDPKHVILQYQAEPFLQIRSENPLPEIVDITDDLCTKSEIPLVKHHPKSYGYKLGKRHPTLISGAWSDNPCKFGTLSIHTREAMLDIPEAYCPKDCNEILLSSGILCSFAWSLALASMNGFTPYNDVTYPVTNQTIVTDGKVWSFFTFQLNTVIPSEENPLRNICWHTEEMNLFEKITENEVVGFNDETLSVLLKFFCHEPKSKDVDMAPYLEETKLSEEEFALIKKKQLRAYRNKHYQNFKEQPLWSKIYRIKQEHIPRKL